MSILDSEKQFKSVIETYGSNFTYQEVIKEITTLKKDYESEIRSLNNNGLNSGYYTEILF